MSAAVDAAPAPAFDCRVAFAEELIALARADERIVAVCNDSVGSSNLGAFAAEFPDRLINVGIAEQDMVGIGAGLALSGFVPFVCAAAPFLTGRALEQIKADVAYSQAPVVLCGMSPGMAYGELGPTHHSIEDLSLAAGHRRAGHRGARRPRRDPRRGALGGGRRDPRLSADRPVQGPRRHRRRPAVHLRCVEPAA